MNCALVFGFPSFSANLKSSNGFVSNLKPIKQSGKYEATSTFKVPVQDHEDPKTLIFLNPKIFSDLFPVN